MHLLPCNVVLDFLMKTLKSKHRSSIFLKTDNTWSKSLKRINRGEVSITPSGKFVVVFFLILFQFSTIVKKYLPWYAISINREKGLTFW